MYGVGWRQALENCQAQLEKQGLGLVPLAWPTTYRLERFESFATPKVWCVWWGWVENENGCNLSKT